jgi:hypothetical protein
MACFDTWDIGACGCNPGIVVTVWGCFDPLGSYSISLYTSSGGSLVGNYTTDSGGVATLPQGTFWVTSSDGRFAGSSTIYSYPCDITLVPASGYHCLSGTICNLPVADTLTYTDPNGSITLTYNLIQGFWLGCSVNPAMANSAIWAAGVCTIGTYSVHYSVTFDGTACAGAGSLAITWCTTPAKCPAGTGRVRPISTYNGHTPACLGYTMGCATLGIAPDRYCNSWTGTCPLFFSAGGTNGSVGGAGGTDDPAVGTWTLTE